MKKTSRFQFDDFGVLVPPPTFIQKPFRGALTHFSVEKAKPFARSRIKVHTKKRIADLKKKSEKNYGAARELP